MIIKSFNLSNLNKMDCNLVLLFGENEGLKEEVIKNYFLNNFSGEVFNYDEDQILQSRDTFFENCLNESLFENEKIIKVNRVTTKLYDVIKDQLPKPQTLFEAYKEIIPAVIKKSKNPSYYIPVKLSNS